MLVKCLSKINLRLDSFLFKNFRLVFWAEMRSLEKFFLISMIKTSLGFLFFLNDKALGQSVELVMVDYLVNQVFLFLSVDCFSQLF